MDTRYTLDARWRARGAVRPLLVAIIAIIILLAVAAWFLIIKPHRDVISADSTGRPSTPATSAEQTQPPPANVAAMDINQLLSGARNAMNEQRYLAPAGNNAFEFYLRVLEKDPGNQVASDALRETFPFAATSAEQAINSRAFDEAQRQIDLLAKADPTNFTLTILRSKLDAQRKTLDQQQQLALEQERAQQLASQRSAAEQAAAEQAAELEKARLAEQQAAQARAAQQASQQAARSAASSAATQPAAQSTATTTAAVLVRSATARYPTAAMRARQEGWVLVSFTVNVDGDTTDISVVDSQPRRVFDRAAIDAVERYHFEPATKNGVPVPTVTQQRIEFKL